MMKIKMRTILNSYLAVLIAIALPVSAWSQDPDSSHLPTDSILKGPVIVVGDSIPSQEVKEPRVYSPRKAAIRSAIIPGWGQVYNRKYWKVPIVYGALGTTAGIFVYNLKNYKDTRFAYRVKYNMRVNGTDSALFNQIKPILKPLSESSLRSYRDQFRRDIDYSVLFFIAMWGLNVVDAAVDAHLKGFDVSPDLSFKLKPGRSQMSGTTGLSLVMHIGKNPDYERKMWRTQF